MAERPPETMPKPASPSLWTKNFLLLILLNLVTFCNYYMFPSALPPWVKTWGVDDHVLGWLTGIATIATLLARPFAGMALDRLERKGVFAAGLAIMLLASAAHYFFPIVGILLALRFIHGIGWSIANTSANTIVPEYIPKARFGEGMGYFSLASSFAMAIAPAIALSLPPGPMIWTATAFVSLAFILSLTMKHPPRPPKEPHTGKRLFPYEKAAILPAVTIFMITTTHGAVTSFTALYAAQRGIGNIGLFFTLQAAALIVTRPLSGKIGDKRGFTALTLFSAVIVAASLALLASADSMPLFLLSGMLFGAGRGAMQTATQITVLLNTPKERFGAANATYFTGFDGGIAFGSIIAGILSSAVGYSDMFLILMACPMFAGVLYLARMRFERRTGPPAEENV